MRQLVLAEPREPLIGGLDSAVVVDRQYESLDQTGNGAFLARGVAVGDRLLRQVVRDAPAHRAAAELSHHVRLGLLELGPQQLAEQMVVAIPLASPVEGHDEAVRARELLERACRPRRLEHGVAETAAHAM